MAVQRSEAGTRREPRHRLQSLRVRPATVDADPEPAVDRRPVVEGPAVGGGPVDGGPIVGRPVVGGPVVGGGAAGRLVRRWLPVDAERPRFDLGRRAALWLAAVVLLAAVVAGAAVWRSRPVPEPVPQLRSAVEAAPTADAVELVVSVAGFVVTPGLVRLQPGARVADAVQAAGGPVPGTDLTGVNLARKLSDGEHVVVGPQAPATAPVGSAGERPSGSGARIDLNTATLAELDTLPGVGPVTAQRIVDWRDRNGRFASVDQLREIEGIGETRFGRLKDLVTA